ncbi:hypothetical protein [Dyadobacter jejuensis]|nr:hypothetical protein [Dyadobacter jejuensis]
MKLTRLVLGYIGLALLGCSSAKQIPYQAKWNAPFNYVDGLAPDQQDQQSRLAYGIINDDSFLYITLKTKDPNTIQKILSSGLKITLNPEGQRKGQFSLQFPVVMKEDRRALRNLDMDMPNSLGLSLLLDSYNKEALWKDQQGQHFINLVEPDGSIKSVISMGRNNELTEQIILPFSLINMDLAQVQDIGIVIEIDGQSSRSGISPRIGIGLGGGIGMGSGMGVGIGTGSGYGNNNSDRAIKLKLDVKLATNI